MQMRYLDVVEETLGDTVMQSLIFVEVYISGGPKKIILGPKKVSFLTAALRDFWFFTIYLLLCSGTKKPSGF